MLSTASSLVVVVGRAFKMASTRGKVVLSLSSLFRIVSEESVLLSCSSDEVLGLF